VTRLDRLCLELTAISARAVDDPARRQAAVALILVPEPDRVLIIRRAVRRGDPWSGQLALPGGRRAPGDTDLYATARRETREEVGVVLPPHGATPLDDLAPRTPTLPPIVVRPFLVILDREPAIRSNDEVAAHAWVPLADLAAPGARGAATVSLDDRAVPVLGYRLPEGLLWGMTERILTPVVSRWAGQATEALDIRPG
jgi:8-oxo-dGTP pyrophosphatase MutT (NUDIX family)